MSHPFNLGFRQLPDERDKRFPLSRLMKAVGSVPVSKVWRPGPVNDQGSTSGCVGYSCFKLQTSEPVLTPESLRMTEEEIYWWARNNDEFPGNEDAGTSVRAGLEGMRVRGIIGGYYWSKDYREAIEFMLTTGPLEIGVNWYEDMFYPDSNGLIVPGGQLAGGHAIFIYAADWQNQFVTLRNSWGTEWGQSGDCILSFKNFDRLLKEEGVCASVSEPQPA